MDRRAATEGLGLGALLSAFGEKARTAPREHSVTSVFVWHSRWPRLAGVPGACNGPH